MNDNITKQDVIDIIYKREISNFRNHFFTFWNRSRYISGEIKSKEIHLWKTNYWISGGFPVFKFEFNANDELVNITSHKNEFAKYSSYLFFVPFVLAILYLLIESDLSFASLVLPFALLIIFVCLYFVTQHIYEYEKRQLLIELYDILDIDYKNEKTNEYSIGKLIIRLLMYPLCIFLIMTSLFIIRDALFHGIIVILLSSAYLISDIFILFKKK